jgi:hypothetical protein
MTVISSTAGKNERDLYIIAGCGLTACVDALNEGQHAVVLHEGCGGRVALSLQTTYSDSPSGSNRSAEIGLL